jgi:DNA ligase (NAD+)
MLNHNYYTLDNPIVSDAEYDRLYDELVQIENEHPELVVPHLPTMRVGVEILSKFQKNEHTTQLYSLAKSQDYEGIIKIINDVKKEANG